ncbi:DUF4394 domain-containing protein [Solimonas sp. SE-A11]|uniref:DUF4394 domain-containing protein n=1 Tax=Solimonas sp. SE-A11 TaxID=3054954 RepID=UPI00259D1F7C|nr:DUF4394 domain-containing protein [Solimonas sp. SE-A11]MDM4770577.1 DUF4394 domain-containing protein [Solimonas sp. SE-A11]
MNKLRKHAIACAAMLLSASMMAGCDNNDDDGSSGGSGGGGAVTIIAVNDSGEMIRFSSATPGTVTQLTLAGLRAGESIVSMDYDPFTGVLHAVGDAAAGGPRLVTIAISGTTATLTNVSDFNFTLTPTGQYDIDFNPSAVERFRYVDSGRENGRINSASGAIAGTDGTLTYAATDANSAATPQIAGLAYNNNVSVGGTRPAATATTAYGIDVSGDRLVTVGSVNATPDSPNTGTLHTVGALGVDMFLAPFDISAGNQGFAASFLPGGTSPRLFSINLATGAATDVGAIATPAGGGGGTIRALAIQP